MFLAVRSPPKWQNELQVYAHKVYRSAYSVSFLHLPLHAGGPGCPSLPVCNLSLLFQSYLEASISWNPLSWAAVTYLLDSPAPFSEGHELRCCLAFLRTRVRAHPFPHIHHATVHCDACQALPLPDVVWVITDSALTSEALGGGIVLFHPLLGVLHTYSFGFLVVHSYGYSNPMGYQTSDFRLLWTTPPNPQPPKPPMIDSPPPQYQTSGQVENGTIWNLGKRSTWGKV